MVKLNKTKTSSSRVGAEYQAIIPPLMEKYEPSELMRFANGLPIPVTWVPDDQPITNNEEAIDSNEANEPASVDGLRPLPALSIEPWSATERGGFLLGIYVFGKNFPVIERFIESKDHRSIVSYYYQEFRASGEHRRWLEWQKERCTRPMKARKLFIGWSYQELISRLSSNVTDEIKDRLIRDGMRYIEGRLPPSRFVFNLKHHVGLSLLVEAVAIGQEDRDLLAFRPITDLSYYWLEAPIENARYSSLTLGEILETLNGNARLSKARSIDLFWDAVWPRLLANGWHSEQPQNNDLDNSKSFVFLAPGVVEFSCNELKKGIDYFDSLTDVLSKVVSEPKLIELESDLVQVLDTDQDLDLEEHLADIQPDIPQENQDLEMFTIVDASLDHDNGGIVKLMEVPTYTVEEWTDELDVNESRNQVHLVPRKMFTIVDTSLDPKNYDGFVKLMELPSFPVSEPFDVVEQGLNEKDFNNSGNGFNRKSNEPDNESNSQDVTGKNIVFQGKTPSGNAKHEETVEKMVEEQIVVDMDLSQMVPYMDPDQSSISEIPTTNQLPFSSDVEADMLQQLALGPPQRRQSTRSRMLSTKALETLAFGYLSPKKKRKGAEEKTPRRVRGVTVAVSGGGDGARNVENAVDGGFGGALGMVDGSRE